MEPSALLLTTSSLLVGLILAYDAKRAVWPRIPGEQAWRRGRVFGTTGALVALGLLQRTAGPLWVKRVAILALIITLGVVLRCSVPLKRLVAQAVQRRKGE